MHCNVFGRILGVSMQGATDIEKPFSFPLTPISTSLCHLDGKISNTEIAAVMKILINDLLMPTHVDVFI